MTDEVDDLLLHVLRVKGVATVVDLESASGLEAVGQRVEPLVQTGLVTRVGEGEQALFGLTEQRGAVRGGGGPNGSARAARTCL